MKDISFMINWDILSPEETDQEIIEDFNKMIKKRGVDVVNASVVHYGHGIDRPLVKVTIHETDEDVKNFFDFYDGHPNSITTVKILKERLKERGF